MFTMTSSSEYIYRYMYKVQLHTKFSYQIAQFSESYVFLLQCES